MKMVKRNPTARKIAKMKKPGRKSKSRRIPTPRCDVRTAYGDIVVDARPWEWVQTRKLALSVMHRSGGLMFRICLSVEQGRQLRSALDKAIPRTVRTSSLVRRAIKDSGKMYAEKYPAYRPKGRAKR